MYLNYLFEVDCLGFRKIDEIDINYLIELDGDPETMRFFPDGAQSAQVIKEKIERYKREYEQRGYGALIVFDLVTGEFIGRAGFGDIETGETEVGYVILKKYWEKGYGTRILKALLNWAKDHIAKDKIIAYTSVDHKASERVMQKAGMVFSRKVRMKGLDCVLYEFNVRD